MYSTFLGGTSDDRANGIAIDSTGAAYIVGQTNSSDFPATPGAYAHTQRGFGSNAFVAKLNASGSSLVYATYLGTGYGRGVAVDSSNFAYVTGDAYCCSFPTTAGAYQQGFSGSYDAFVTKLNQTGSALVWSSLLGGSNTDSGIGIALDSSQNVYVTGSTYSTTFPVTGGAYQTAFAGYQDVFVSKFNSTGTALVYSTLLGGATGTNGNQAYQQGSGIAVDSSGYAYVTGWTSALNFPTTLGAYRPAPAGYQDAFVTKVNQTGSALLYSTMIGSSTTANGIAVDSSGNAYVILAGGSVPVTAGAFNSNSCCSYVSKLNATGTNLIYSSQIGYASFTGIAVDAVGDAYVAGSSSGSYPVTGSALVFSTYLGGNGGDQGLGVALSASGNAYVTGSAGSLDFPVTIEAAKSLTGPYTQTFVAQFDASGAGLVYSTFVSGSGNDAGRAIAVDSSDAAHVTGQTNSTDFPTTVGALQTTIGGLTMPSTSSSPRLAASSTRRFSVAARLTTGAQSRLTAAEAYTSPETPLRPTFPQRQASAAPILAVRLSSRRFRELPWPTRAALVDRKAAHMRTVWHWTDRVVLTSRASLVPPIFP
jgi:hypothetical protein